MRGRLRLLMMAAVTAPLTLLASCGSPQDCATVGAPDMFSVSIDPSILGGPGDYTLTTCVDDAECVQVRRSPADGLEYSRPTFSLNSSTSHRVSVQIQDATGDQIFGDALHGFASPAMRDGGNGCTAPYDQYVLGVSTEGLSQSS